MEEQPLVHHPPEYYDNLMNGADYCERIMSEPMPPGMRFLPTDVELVRVYLRHKLIVGSLPQGFQKLFLDVALYQHNPQQLIAMHEKLEDDQEDWYFFTPRIRRYPNGQRPERTAGDGYWKAIGKDTPVVENDGEVIGFKRVLDFYEGRHPGGVKTEWKMHEYLTKEQKDHTPASTSMQLNQWVLCKIYKNKRSGKKRKSSMDHVEDDDDFFSFDFPM
ncbi:NAC transcription factor 56-like [Sesamum indicum]|uniref:NAC transcription factor 56-like n=1 Tax=Sesamum indicum TaxID=4182 RepID=A0A6I9TRU5_SESIN|nr:NAC transcription factor 56-like [Sesamum indicum]